VGKFSTKTVENLPIGIVASAVVLAEDGQPSTGRTPLPVLRRFHQLDHASRHVVQPAPVCHLDPSTAHQSPQ
jgi:hypothetical protein